MKKIPKCKQCNIDFEEGYIPDYSYASAFKSMWVKGEPDEHKFLGIKIGGIEPPKIKEGIPIKAYRCSECGLIEFYAI